jgi:hypothetical protein
VGAFIGQLSEAAEGSLVESGNDQKNSLSRTEAFKDWRQLTKARVIDYVNEVVARETRDAEKQSDLETERPRKSHPEASSDSTTPPTPNHSQK